MNHGVILNELEQYDGLDSKIRRLLNESKTEEIASIAIRLSKECAEYVRKEIHKNEIIPNKYE